MESPGAVFYDFRGDNMNQGGIRQIRQAFMSVLPHLTILFIWVCTVGALFWVVDTIPNKDGEDRSVKEMFHEVFEAIWWAFITMATVGLVLLLHKLLL